MLVVGLQSAAVGVNQRGQVVANAGDSMSTSGVSSYGAETHAFLWEKDRITPLGDLGGGHSRATAINDRGEIAYLTEHWNTWHAARSLLDAYDVAPARPFGDGPVRGS